MHARAPTHSGRLLAAGGKQRSGADPRLWTSVYCLQLPYLAVAQAALAAGDHFAALLYAEHWCEAQGGGAAELPPDVAAAADESLLEELLAGGWGGGGAGGGGAGPSGGGQGDERSQVGWAGRSGAGQSRAGNLRLAARPPTASGRSAQATSCE
jgi:hypothetical protein